jgi:hypothetical protein
MSKIILIFHWSTAREYEHGMDACLKILLKLLQEKTSVPLGQQDTVTDTLRRENICLTDLALFPA